MRRWGLLVTTFYGVLAFGLFWPAVDRLAVGSWPDWPKYRELFLESGDDGGWVVPLLLVAGQALLLFITVDTSWRRIRPRRHLAIAATTVGLFMTLLALGFVSSLWAAIPSLDNSRVSPQEKVDVGTRAAAIDASSTTLSRRIRGTEASELPVQGRLFLELPYLTTSLRLRGIRIAVNPPVI